MGSNSEATYERLQATARTWLDGYNQATKLQDITRVSATNTPDCMRYFAPKTLVQMLPILAGGRTNEGYEQQEKGIFANWKETDSDILDMTVDDRQRKVVLSINHHCVTFDGAAYDFEHNITLFMTDDGTKVKKISQFCDTLQAKGFLDAEKWHDDILNTK